MKRIIFALLTLALITTWSGDSLGKPKGSLRQYFNEHRNLLVNPGFEEGAASWVASTPAHFSLEKTTPGLDKAHGKWDPAASTDWIRSAAVTIPPALENENCTWKLRYKGSSGTTDIQLEAYDGSNVLTSIYLPVKTSWVTAHLEFPCGASGSTRYWRMYANADADEIEYDDTGLGVYEIIDLSQSVLYGTAVTPTTTNCSWATSSGSYADFPVDSNCPVPTVAGKISAPDTKIPAIKLVNPEPGKYVVTFNGKLESFQTSSCVWRMTDGTTASSYAYTTRTADYFILPNTLVAEFDYTTPPASATISIQTRRLSGTNDCVLPADDNDEEVQFTVLRFPVDSEQAIKPDTAAWYINANLGGSANASLGTATVTTYTDISDANLDLVPISGSASVGILCDDPATEEQEVGDLTCTGAEGDESLGVTFIADADLYEVCAEFGAFGDAGSGGAVGQLIQTFQLVETPNNALTISQEGASRTTRGHADFDGNEGFTTYSSYNLCGLFSFASAGKKSIRLYYEQLASNCGGSYVLTDRLAAHGQRDMRWTAKKWLSAEPAPLLVNSYVSPYAGVTRKVSARITNGGTPAIGTERGDWIDGAPNDEGVGDVSLDIVAGIFASGSVPICTVTPIHPTTGTRIVAFRGTPSASLVRVFIQDSAFVAADTDFNIECEGDI